MSFQGFSRQLQTAEDLMAKLEDDFARIRHNPRDAYAAFDFFVTADHIEEWRSKGALLRHPDGHEDGGLLRLVCHLGSGAKHFKAKHPGHKSVKNIDDVPGAFQAGAFQSDAFDVGSLVVDHEGFDGVPAGAIEVVALATRVIEYWRARFT